MSVDAKPLPEAPPMAGRWRIRLANAAIVLLILSVAVWAGDYAYYRSRVPIGFYDANWIGQWKTDSVGLIRGRLLVKLPEPLPENEPFQAEALVYYPIYSVYRTGRFVRMDFAAEYAPDKASAAGSADGPPNEPKGGKLKFKGEVGGQVVEYVALFSNGERRIIGSYESTRPYDFGHFLLEKQ